MIAALHAGHTFKSNLPNYPEEQLAFALEKMEKAPIHIAWRPSSGARRYEGHP